MNNKLLDESPFPLGENLPKEKSKELPRRNGYHYLGESGATFVYTWLTKAIQNTKQQIIVDYEGKSKHTMKNRWYLGKRYLDIKGFKEYDLDEFKIAFKGMFAVLTHDVGFRLKKEYSSPTEYKVKTREEWKKDLLFFIENGGTGEVFELKDCIHLVSADKKFLSSVADGVCETEVMTDTWLRLKHL